MVLAKELDEPDQYYIFAGQKGWVLYDFPYILSH